MNLKNLKKILTLLFLITYSANVSAQDNPTYRVGPDGKKNLSGLWIASCPFEYINHATATHCPLCDMIPDSANPDSKTVLPLKMIFEKDSIRLNNTNKWHTVGYSMNENSHTFRFHFMNTEYKFRVFYWGEYIVLENSDGLPVILRRED